MPEQERKTPLAGNQAVVLFSGGSDSTCTALLAAERFDRVHLLTFRRFGMFGVERSDTNFQKLKQLFGPDKFIRPPFIRVDRLFHHLSHGTWLKDVRGHGLMTLTTCGVCKLAMHLRALVYCLEHDIRNINDGANRNMYIFPEQMESVLGLLRDLYGRCGIRYENPVFDYDDPQGINFGSRLFGLSPARRETAHKASDSTGAVLVRHGIIPHPDVKGTAVDRRMQARCFQFVLFNIFARWYFLERYDFEEYGRRVHAFYRDKIDQISAMLNAWGGPGARERSLLGRLLEQE